MIEVNVLSTLACSVINGLLVSLVGYSISLLRWLGKVHRLDGGRSQQLIGIRVGLDVLLWLKV